MTQQLFDVIEVRISTQRVTAILARNKTEGNANAIEAMAVLRRGVQNHFFVTVPTGSYKEGEGWKGDCDEK